MGCLMTVHQFSTLFLVLARSLLDETWEGRCARITELAGRQADSTEVTRTEVTWTWRVGDFHEALRLRWRLELIKELKVSLREE